jgi:hypothetical protein
MKAETQSIAGEPILRQLYATVLAGDKWEKLPLFFDARVLDHYRQNSNFQIIRTDTSGRLKKTGGWSLDFGISGEGDSIIQVALESLTGRLPETEHEHWLSHLITLPLSSNYVKGLVRPGCLDDGPIRPW